VPELKKKGKTEWTKYRHDNLADTKANWDGCTKPKIKGEKQGRQQQGFGIRGSIFGQTEGLRGGDLKGKTENGGSEMHMILEGR